MKKVLTAAQMREVDRLTTERYVIPSIILMENAAHAVARVIAEKLGGSVKDRRILILCGKGNNGGDGAAVARILWSLGASCFVYLAGAVDEAKGDALINLKAVRAIDEKRDVPGLNENVLFLTEMPDAKADEFVAQWRSMKFDVFVDALIGTGFSGELRSPYNNYVKAMQGRRFGNFDYLVSVDIPSGFDSDRGQPSPIHASADITITFTAPKPGNVLPPESNSNGEMTLANIGSPQELIDEQPSQLYLAEKEDAAAWLKQTEFSNDSYKNKRGHVLLVAGSEDYSGAAALAANSAMRSGVGLTTLACPKNAKELIASRLLPEVILSTIESDEFAGHLERADAVAIGCGLDANDPQIEKLVRDLVENRTTAVIVDAGALWFFNPPSKNHPVGEGRPPLLRKEGSQEGAPLILTPHEGEFLRLLGTDDKDAIKDRVAAVREFTQKNEVILVLKGERVLIGHPDGRVVVNPTGNSGLGKAGNGDTLAGILAGFTAQAAKMNIDIFETVVAAVYIAGMAGDIAETKFSKRVMTASDVRECLTDVFREFEIV